MKDYYSFKKMLLFANRKKRLPNHRFIIFDNEINYIVQIRTFSEPLLAGTFIKATTLNGIVSLDGYADTFMQIELAIHIAESVTGVKYVINRIVLRNSANSNK